MNPTYIFWAQLALVGVGAILQLIAFRTFARDPDVHDGVHPQVSSDEVPDHSNEKTSLPAEPPPVKAHHPVVDHSPHEPFSEFHAAKLTKTKRVSFKQDFKGLQH
jgi:hypothetical protein